MKKHIIWLLITLSSITLFCCCSATAAEIVASGTCGAEGDNLTWELDDQGILTISGTGPMNNYSDYNNYAPWYSQKSKIKKITIDEGVTNIGRYSFYYCENLTSVTIPDSITRMGSGAFADCISLTTITIPAAVSSLDRSTFNYCRSLTSINVEDGNTTYCSIDGVLFNHDITELLCFPNGKVCDHYIIPSSVTSVGKGAFSYCDYLTKVTIPDSVTKIGNSAFDHCSNLTNVALPSTLTSISDSLFFGTNISYISLPHNITTIEDNAFGFCRNLTNVIIPSTVTSIGNAAFYYCTNLISVSLPNGINNISDYLFSDCENLRTINLPDTLISIGECSFQGCRILTSITIPDSIMSIGMMAFNCSNVNKVYMSGTSEINIERSAFQATNPTFYCYEFTPNEGWARSKGYTVELLDYLTPKDYVSLVLPMTDYVGLGMMNRLNADIFPYLSEYEATWSSSNPNIVTVDANGVITGVSIGSATVTLSYGGVQASCQVTVLSPEEYIKIILPETVIAGIGKQTHLESAISPLVEGLEQEWSSSDPDVVTVSMDGTLTGVSAGTADITLSYGGVQAVCHVTVVQYAESFSLPDLWLVAKTGLNASSLITDIEPADSVVQFRWSTENSIYATVDANGYVTAGAVGDTTLTVTDELSGLSRTVAVHSCYPVTAIDLSLSENTVYQGTSVQATASVTMRTQNCENHLVTFSSGNPSIAEIDQQGNIQTFQPGTVTITATALDNESISASAILSVTKDFKYILSLPVHLTEIGSEAFAGLPAAEAVRIPESVTSIADDAFSGSSIIILAPDGSYAITWAQDHGFDYLME